MPRTFVIGDIHGAYRALRQCLDRASFNYREDHLICLGDVADGWPDTRACIEELLRIKNLTHLLGNHDLYTLEWMDSGTAPDLWLAQGGEATRQSYRHEVPPGHHEYFKRARPYFVSRQRLFVHAGIDRHTDISHQGLSTFLWDRELAHLAMAQYREGVDKKLTRYREVYIGHTPTPFGKPVRSGDVWLMDTGAGWSGVLSLLDIDTYATFVSDPVPSLYPGVQGRSRF